MRASGYDRAANDYYVEPRWLIDALLDVESLSGTSWDPSCGGGNIPMAMRDRGLECRGSDIADRGFGITGADFFSETCTAHNIVTNPPFGVIEPYIRHALKLTTSKVCILARLALLEGQARRPLFYETPFARVWVSSRRASMRSRAGSSGCSICGPGGGAVITSFGFRVGIWRPLRRPNQFIAVLCCVKTINKGNTNGW